MIGFPKNSISVVCVRLNLSALKHLKFCFLFFEKINMEILFSILRYAKNVAYQVYSYSLIVLNSVLRICV